jgi:hypothetical protein
MGDRSSGAAGAVDASLMINICRKTWVVFIYMKENSIKKYTLISIIDVIQKI